MRLAYHGLQVEARPTERSVAWTMCVAWQLSDFHEAVAEQLVCERPFSW